MKKALLIEDDPQARHVVGSFLREYDWTVIEAEDGEAGIQLAKQHRPEVVLCDLLMPRCNGFQVIRAIRADRALRQCRIIVTSGRDYAVDRYNAFEAGADDYFSKPFRLQDMIECMKGQHTDSQPAETGTITLHSQNLPGEPFFRFWGVRGSVPTPGKDTVFYGGNTTCVEVRADGQIVVLDAGTGIRSLGLELVREFAETPIQVNLLLTHTHWDHIQGFPFFAPLYDKRNIVRVRGFEGARDGLANILTGQMESPYFPVGLKALTGSVSIEELKEMQFKIGAVAVKSTFANHPGICVGYRLDTSAGSLAFLPDNEPYLVNPPFIPEGKNEKEATEFAAAQDARLVEFLFQVDHLILDTQYDAEEYRTHRGWGHGCLDEVVALAMRAGARNLYLFHHDPSHDDTKISHMVAHSREIVAAAGADLKVEASREGETIELGRSAVAPH